MSSESTAIQSVAVVGAGQMGAGIAQVAARAGLAVTLSDQAEAQAAQAVAKMAARLRRQEAEGKVAAGGADELLGRIRTGGPLFGVAEADLVIEAAPEQVELKTALFRSFSSEAKATAILASNTSSLSITRLARETARPQLVIGMHFMNPVPVMKLVEVVKGFRTTSDTVARVRTFAEALGKLPIEVKDAPGFVVNRVLFPMINEAAFALQEQVSDAKGIDECMKLGCNHPMGPLALADLVGLDVVYAILDSLYREYGEPRYRPCLEIKKRVEAGWLGRKTGRGFYHYDS
jgi:3-hydroxybutyryl-CoA dehydrogenase